MTKKLLILLIAFNYVFISGCTSPTEETESDIAEDLSTVEAESSGGDSSSADEKADENFEEFGEDEVAEESPADQKSENNEETVAEDDQLEEKFDEEPKAEPQPEPDMLDTAQQAPEPSPADKIVNNRVTEINYLDSTSGGAVEIKTTSPATYSMRPSTNANQFVVEIQNAALADSLKRPYIMKDFESVFGTINAYQNPGGRTARIVIQMKGAGEPVITQEGNTLLVTAPGMGDVLKLAKQKSEDEKTLNQDKDSYNTREAQEQEKILGARTLDEFLTGSGRFFGRPISIQTNGADIRDVITFIAEESGVNLVIADDVDGKVSLKLRQVPWDQALVIVMRSKGLGYVRQGNVLRITKLSTLQAEAEAAKKIVDSQKSLAPLKVKVMPVSFASVDDLEKQVKPFLTETRGKVVSDTRTSSIIITDTAEVLMKVERLIKELDIPPAQVMIEGKIVEASETFTRRLGVNWSLSGSPVEVAASGGRNGSPIIFSQSLSVANMAQNQVAGGNGTLNLHVGSLDLLGSLDATLSLAQVDNLVRIISSPRIVTMNKEKAEISQESQVITVQSLTDVAGNKTASSKAIPVELKLTVTPQITADGSVVLDMAVMRQFAGAEADAITKAKPINSRSAKTKVLVPNGQTAVIGGIYQSDETESESGVPGLKDIPVLGWLFKQKFQEKNKTELLLFLTPRILNAKDQAVTN